LTDYLTSIFSALPIAMQSTCNRQWALKFCHQV